MSRHPARPYTLDYIKAICGDTWLELHGDRGVKDDKAMIGGLGKIATRALCSSVSKKVLIPRHVSIAISVWQILRDIVRP